MGTTTMDGTEQAIFESTELGEYSGYIFFDKMVSGDTIIIRIYVKDPNDINKTYKKWLEDSYSGALTTPALRLEPIISKLGVKVTLQQSAGSYKQVTHTWFKR
jgi:hypothetical protein